MTFAALGPLAPSHSVQLPPTPRSWHEYDYSVQSDGTLTLLRTSIDIHYRVAESIKEGKKIGRHVMPQLWPCDLRISQFNGKRETAAIVLRVHGRPRVGRMADGRWLISIWGRQEESETGGWLYDERGRELGRFPLGYALDHLRCANDGTVWAGYYDQGVFAGPLDDNLRPVSNGGVVRFSPDGEVLWSMNDDEAAPFCDHCYVLCIDNSGRAWTCTYGDFPIACVDDGSTRSWKNQVHFIDALATDGKHALLAGGFGSETNRVVLVRFSAKTAIGMAEWTFNPPSSSRPGCIEGWGDTLHVVDGDRWHQYRLRDAVAQWAAKAR